MRLGTREDNQKNTHALNADNNVATRVIITNPAPADALGPSNLLLNGSLNVDFDEGQPSGTTVGTLSVSNGVPPITYTIEGTSDFFEIDGVEVKSTQVLDSTTLPVANLGVRATDANGKFTLSNFQITIIPTGGFVNQLSYEFRGNGFINVPDNAYAGNVPTSWWAWIKYDEKPSSIEHIFNSQNGSANSGVRLTLNNTGVDIIFNVIRSNGNQKDYRYFLPVDYDYGVWHLYGFVIENNSIELYIDGALQTPNVINADQNTGNVFADGVNTYMGSNSNGTDEYFEGLMSGIAYSVQSGGLTQSQWISLYNGGVQGDYDDQIGESSYRNLYRATSSGVNIGDPIIQIDDSKGSIDAVGLNVFASGDTPTEYQNTVSTEFDGSSNYFIGTGTNNIDFTQPKTFVFWIKRTTPLATDTIFSNRVSNAAAGFSFYMDSNGSQRFYFEIQNGTQDLRCRWSLGSGTVNNWTHVVVTMPANVTDANDVELYVNGSNSTRAVQANDLVTYPTFNNSLAIGADTDGGNKIDARVNEIAVLDVESDATYAQELYNLSIPINIRNTTNGDTLAQRWRMGNGNGLTSQMIDDVGGEPMVMINFDSAFYVSDTPP